MPFLKSSFKVGTFKPAFFSLDILSLLEKIPKNKLDEILKRDIWWDAQQCLEYGMIDEII